MKEKFCPFNLAVLIATAFTAFSVLPQPAFANPPGFGKSLEEIAKLAEKEGRVHIASGLDDEESKEVIQKFNRRYPGIKVENTQVTGAGNERIFTELVAGNADYDAVNINSESVPRYKKAGLSMGPFDWAMIAQQTPKEHFSPDGYFAAVGFITYVIAYNPSSVSAGKVPKDWRDCLDPYWKGKFVVDTRPKAFTALYSAWGEKKTLEFAAQLKANQPAWKRGQSDTLNQIVAGEYSMLCGSYYQSALRIMTKDPKAKLAVAFPRETPGHLTEIWTVVKGAKSPNAALLISGWLASREGREEYDQLGIGSLFDSESRVAKLIQKAGAKAVSGGWMDNENIITQKIVSTWGLSPQKK
jgi:ABC-type Fe3+ transport system substrate-binding protein